MAKSYDVVGYAGDGAEYCLDCAPLPDFGDPGAVGWTCPECKEGKPKGNSAGTYACRGCEKEYEFDFDPVFAGDVTCEDDACDECGDCLSCGGPCENADADDADADDADADDADDDSEESDDEEEDAE